MRFKILREIHTNQNNKTVYKIYTRIFYMWIPADVFNNSDTFEEAEQQIIGYYEHNHSGILTVDNNIYSYKPFTITL